MRLLTTLVKCMCYMYGLFLNLRMSDPGTHCSRMCKGFTKKTVSKYIQSHVLPRAQQSPKVAKEHSTSNISHANIKTQTLPL